jgi:arginine decarboxylase
VISKEIIKFLLALDVKEIHGYRPDLGLKVFTEKVLKTQENIPARSERMTGVEGA